MPDGKRGGRLSVERGWNDRADGILDALLERTPCNPAEGPHAGRLDALRARRIAASVGPVFVPVSGFGRDRGPHRGPHGFRSQYA